MGANNTRHSEESVLAGARAANLYWLAGEYQSVNSKLLMGCQSCHRRAWKTGRTVLRKYRCRWCAQVEGGLKRRLSEQEISDQFAASDLELLEYGGTCMVPSLCRCKTGGHELLIRLNDVQQGHGCRQCFNARQKKKYAVTQARKYAVASLRSFLASLIRYIKSPDYVGMSNVTCRTIGCTRPFFKTYVEARFLPGMTWTNWGRGPGKWNLDHIIPLKSFDILDPEQFLICNRYTNFQPLWSKDNQRKGCKLPASPAQNL